VSVTSLVTVTCVKLSASVQAPPTPLNTIGTSKVFPLLVMVWLDVDANVVMLVPAVAENPVIDERVKSP